MWEPGFLCRSMASRVDNYGSSKKQLLACYFVLVQIQCPSPPEHQVAMHLAWSLRVMWGQIYQVVMLNKSSSGPS